ncbi:methylase of polypeptide subunit release factors [Nitrosomonas sp. Nm84]|uniref:methyltransferase n=1 Tax=Nitrosomonas sp. Nm84 TaxID=200124 RepID=UPI000D76207F|nr:class I SAM-dependent methyltransferase [Nitrosomonas sp. Nm84]PXW88872.1 methylase of polypeptide subunit release factors [Nitrosomonas sp. Nm84]
MSDRSIICWHEAGEEKSARWHSEKDLPPPKRVQVIDDRMTADTVYRLACEGTALLWQGDFQNARQLLQALARRIDKKRPTKKTEKLAASPAETFHLHRQTQSQRARTLGNLLIPFNADHSIPLRRAPDVRAACLEAYGPSTEAYIASLRELQGLIGAYEWRKKGIEIPALGARIHPHYGVFAPIRSEYVELVAEAPLPQLVAQQSVAFDIGTGTGILAAVLARRGIQHIIATDQDGRALNCARDNLTRLGLINQVDVIQADLFPTGQAALIVCNPPWIPARPSSPLEHAIFDPESRMLRGFLHGLNTHLAPGGEGWLILSDFAQHLGLRTRDELLSAIDAASLKVLSKTDIKPHHPRVSDTSDPLHAARAAELTSLWRLTTK